MNMYPVWAKQLQDGETIKFRPHGNSMTPLIKSGQLVTIEPFKEGDEITDGMVVFVKVRGYYYTHLVSAVKGDQVQISNNHGHVNGWTNKKKVFGRVTTVED